MVVENLAHQFMNYTSEATGLPVALGPRMAAKLPQFLTQLYTLRKIEVGQRQFLGIFFKNNNELRPATFEKHVQRMMSAAGDLEGYCLIARDLPSYVRQRLIERHIPFVVPGRQLYWPALGAIVAARQKRPAPEPVETVSPAAQTVLLLALNGEIVEPLTPRALAARLAYTPMTMTRALDEIEANRLGRVVRQGRERIVEFPENRAALWEAALPYLRNPVRQTVRLRKAVLPADRRLVAGETALAAVTMLAPPREPVYAIGRKGWKQLRDSAERIPIPEVDTCQVQLWHYEPALFGHGRVDSFSLYLSLRDEQDERVQAALQELMEQLQWP